MNLQPEVSRNKQSLLRASDISRKYGSFSALNSINIDIRDGDKILLLGPNGSGKSTLLKILSGRLRASAGKVSLLSETNLSQIRRKVAYQGDATQLYGPLTVRENFDLFSSLASRASEIDSASLLATWGLVNFQDRALDLLSRGNQTRASLAISLNSSLPVLALDEPTLALDSAGKKILLDSLKKRPTNGGAIILATHEVGIFAEIVNRVVIVKNGAIIEDLVGCFTEVRLNEIYEGICL